MPVLPVLYHPQHTLHAPKIEYVTGRLAEYAEKPLRMDYLMAGLSALPDVAMQEIQETLPREALSAVFDTGLLDYLEKTSITLQGGLSYTGQMYKPEADQEYFYPSVFPARAEMNRLKTLGRYTHGYYFFDTEAPIGKGTWAAAVGAATLAYRAAHMLLNGETRAAYALCRPPGHHAGYDYMGGYCYLNNVALAAHELRALGRVAILDVDYHHGNGTQSLFWDDPNVLFVSLHADPAHDYPYYAGYADEIGGEAGQGTTLNLPLLPGTDDTTYLEALNHGLARIRAFAPAALLVSVGYDTYGEDPLSTFKLSEGIYRVMGGRIAQTAAELNIPLLLVQEGGYATAKLGDLAAGFVQGVLSETAP